MDMLERSNKCGIVSEFVKHHIVLFDCFEQVYLFGSILNTNNIAYDIDILLIYSEFSNTILDTSNIIRSALEKKTEMPIDLTILSIREEKDADFLQRIQPLCLKLK